MIMILSNKNYVYDKICKYMIDIEILQLFKNEK